MINDSPDKQQNNSKYKATIFPTLRYKDGQAAIDWLCKAFGFKTQLA